MFFIVNKISDIFHRYAMLIAFALVFFVVGGLIYQNHIMKKTIEKYKSELLQQKISKNEQLIQSIKDIVKSNKDSIWIIEKQILENKRKAGKRIAKIKSSKNINDAIDYYLRARAMLENARSNNPGK